MPIAVWSIAPNRKEFVRFLGPWRGVWLHWLQTRSLPCNGGQCPICASGQISFWMGYAPALLWQFDRLHPRCSRWKPIVCPVTPGMVDVLRQQPLVGLVVELFRPGRRRNGEILCTIVEAPDGKRLLEPPPAFDVEPILRRMWRLRQPAAPARPMESNGDGQADRGGDADPQPDVLPFRRPSIDDADGEGKAVEL